MTAAMVPNYGAACATKASWGLDASSMALRTALRSDRSTSAIYSDSQSEVALYILRHTAKAVPQCPVMAMQKW
jgi:hypothetical protein